jgi:hypothetical protein
VLINLPKVDMQTKGSNMVAKKLSPKQRKRIRKWNSPKGIKNILQVLK